MTIYPKPEPRFRSRRAIVACLLVIAGLAAALHGCNNGVLFPSGFGELLFVSDRFSVSTYSVSGAAATLQGQAVIPGIPGTYDRTGNTVTVTMSKHLQVDNFWVTLDFGAGTGGTATSGTYIASVIDPDTFTIADTASGTITGGTCLRHPHVQFAATYSQASNVVTVTLPNHHIGSNWGVQLDFTTGGAANVDRSVSSIPSADTFTVDTPDSTSTSGNVTVTVGGNYTIFGLAMHPNGRWVYATSGYDCWNGNPYCWGADLISRFAIDWTTGALTFEQSYRTTDDTVTDPIPVGIVFSPDGLHMVHQDDDLDGLRLWDVDPNTGAITLVANSGSDTAFRHGIAFSADGTHVYNGSMAFMVSAAAITQLPGGGGGDGDQISTIAGVSTLFTITGSNNGETLAAFSLTNPDSPVMIDQTGITPNRARDIAMFNGGALLVTSGFGGLKSYTFNGTAIAAAVGAGNTELIDGGGNTWPSGNPIRMYRSISPNASGNLVAAGYFTHDTNSATGGIPPSGFILANVAADGSLSLAGDFPGSYYTRQAKFFQKP